MEFLAEAFVALLQVLGELLAQLVFELLVELSVRSLGVVFRRPQPPNLFLAGMGYTLLGAIGGGLSLLMFPTSLIRAPWVRILNLVVTPVLAGSLMSALGAWRARREQHLIRLDRFGYAFLFAFAMALVRFIWAKAA